MWVFQKGKNQKDCDVRSEPESDYGSSLDEEKPKVDEIDERKKEKVVHEESRVRPMTAKKQRTSLFGGELRVHNTLKNQTRASCIYHEVGFLTRFCPVQRNGRTRRCLLWFFVIWFMWWEERNQELRPSAAKWTEGVVNHLLFHPHSGFVATKKP